VSGLSTNWRLDRMSRVDLTILRLAAQEILFRADIPKSVSINEAVELAKRFGAEDSPAFVNGLLDKIAKPT
jgi:N utilization substance protein B